MAGPPQARSRDDGKALACLDCCVPERWERRGQSWQAEFVLAAARYPKIQGSKDVGSILTGLADWHQRARAPPHPQKSRVLPARLQTVQVCSVSSFVHDDPGPVLTTTSIVAWYLATVRFRWLYRIDPASKRQPLPFHQVLRRLDAQKKHEFHANSLFSKARCSDLGTGTSRNCKSSSDQPTGRLTDRPLADLDLKLPLPARRLAGQGPVQSIPLSLSPTLHLPRIGATLPPCLLSSTNRGRDPSDPAQMQVAGCRRR